MNSLQGIHLFIHSIKRYHKYLFLFKPNQPIQRLVIFIHLIILHMKAKFDGSFKKADGKGGFRNGFRYVVTGTQQELQEYIESQGQYLYENANGEPLFFSNSYTGSIINLVPITDKNTGNVRFIADTSAFAQAEGMLSNFSNPAMVNAMANIIAKQLLGVKDTETTEA
jgi:hypothetical protein